MNNLNRSLVIAVATLALAGCSQSPSGQIAGTASPAASAHSAAVKVAYELGSIKKGDKGHCVVCVVKEGSKKEEPIVETLDYKGKTYVFCNESEKAEFISDPAKYAAK